MGAKSSEKVRRGIDIKSVSPWGGPRGCLGVSPGVEAEMSIGPIGTWICGTWACLSATTSIFSPVSIRK